MITDNELIRLLELADPARVDDPAPVLEPAEYRDALLTGRTSVRLVDLDPTPSEPSSGRRWLILIAAAAVVVAIALVATRDKDATPADQPSSTVTVPPTTPPRSLLGTLDEQLAPGTYFIDHVDATPTPRIFVTVGEGWGKDYSNGPIIAKDGAIAIGQPQFVFFDACHTKDVAYTRTPGTFDGLVAALSEQKGWVDVTAPRDISIDGYAGKAFQRTAPADMSDCDHANYAPRVRTGSGPYPMFQSWGPSAGGHYEPGQIETLWILDLDGTVVVINTRPYPEASAAAHAEFAAVLDSIRIERP